MYKGSLSTVGRFPLHCYRNPGKYSLYISMSEMMKCITNFNLGLISASWLYSIKYYKAGKNTDKL